jgi:Flp pilus assembly pilin Flp
MAEALLRSGQASPALLASALMTTLDREINMFARFIRDDSGQDLIEYLLLGSFIAIVALVGATALGTNLNNWYNEMASWVSVSSGKIP